MEAYQTEVKNLKAKVTRLNRKNRDLENLLGEVTDSSFEVSIARAREGQDLITTKRMLIEILSG